jgi:hypothetical protein
MVVSEVCAISEVLCLVSDGHLLNPAITHFLMKKKGDALSVLRVLHLSKCRRAYEMCVAHITKWRHTLWSRISSLLNLQKYLHIILHGILLAPTHSVPIGAHT